MFSCFFGLKNVFPTVKILNFSRGEFKYVQMDQGLTEDILLSLHLLLQKIRFLGVRRG
jgi:predicted ribosome-associated RNA-binding protein Tma20